VIFTQFKLNMIILKCVVNNSVMLRLLRAIILPDKNSHNNNNNRFVCPWELETEYRWAKIIIIVLRSM